MKPRSIKKPSKTPGQSGFTATNLYLSVAARRMAGELMTKMMRPSVSNVVEVLIHERAAKEGLLALPLAESGQVLGSPERVAPAAHQ